MCNPNSIYYLFGCLIPFISASVGGFLVLIILSKLSPHWYKRLIMGNDEQAKVLFAVPCVIFFLGGWLLAGYLCS